jgi:hypothetical protein
LSIIRFLTDRPKLQCSLKIPTSCSICPSDADEAADRILPQALSPGPVTGRWLSPFDKIGTIVDQWYEEAKKVDADLDADDRLKRQDVDRLRRNPG